VVLEQITQAMNPLPPLRARKNPWLAFVLGFLLSGVALGVYFRSWIDLIVPTRLDLSHDHLLPNPRRGWHRDNEKVHARYKGASRKGTDEQLSGPTAHRLQAQSVAGTKHSS
jgi:hypothetical protein